MRAQASGRATPTQFDAKYVRKDGTDLWAIVTRTPIFDNDGRYTGSLAMVTDVTERRRLEMEVLEAGQDERRRVGQDLHDTLGQSLAALTLLLKLLGDRLEEHAPEEAAEAHRIGDVAQDAAKQARAIARQLWSAVPRGPAGLGQALAALAEETAETFKVKCVFESDGAVSLADYGTSNQAYLIAREAVTNAVRHGKACDIRIRLSRHDNGVLLVIVDDGGGLPADYAAAKGLGLRSMKYRASMMGASFDIRHGAGRRHGCDLQYPGASDRMTVARGKPLQKKTPRHRCRGAV